MSEQCVGDPDSDTQLSEGLLDELDDLILYPTKFNTCWTTKFQKAEPPDGTDVFPRKKVVLGLPIPVVEWFPKNCLVRKAAVQSKDGSWRYCAVLFGSDPYPITKSMLCGYYKDTKTKERCAVVQLGDVLRRRPPRSLVATDIRLHRSNVVLGRYIGGGSYSAVYKAVLRVLDDSGKEYWKACAIKLYTQNLLRNEEINNLDEFVDREIDCMKKVREWPLKETVKATLLKFQRAGMQDDEMNDQRKSLAKISREYLLVVKSLGKLVGGNFDAQRSVIMQLEIEGNLSERLQTKKHWNFNEIVTNLFCLSHALMHLRDADVLHRDIKPANVFYRRVFADTKYKKTLRPAIPLLGDLGLSKVALEAYYMGARGYQPPYVAIERLPCTRESDTYCLAVVFAQIILAKSATEINSNKDGDKVKPVVDAHEILRSRHVIFQLLPGLKQILLDATRPEPTEGMQSKELFRRLTSSAIFDPNSPYEDLPYTDPGIVLEIFLKHLDISRSKSKSDVPKGIRVQWRRAVDRLTKRYHKFQRLPDSEQRDMRIEARTMLIRWCPHLLILWNILASFSPERKSKLPDSDVLYLHLSTAADCLLVYAVSLMGRTNH